jgi:GTP-binding protein
MATPVIALVGRPNVGKSTLFNVLTGTRQALVAEFPGLTRDRQYGRGKYDGQDFIVIDTGGIGELHDEEMDNLTEKQVQLALEEADIILFMVDALSGLVSADETIAKQLREQYSDKVICVVNKADREEAALVASEFYQLGFDPIEVIAASQKRGVKKLLGIALEHFNQAQSEELLEENPEGFIDKNKARRIRIAIIGKPNVGKSTLVNKILGEERVVVCDRPGTTRDSIAIDYDREDQPYTLIDTAGVRRRTRVHEKIEKFSVIKTLKAIDEAQIIIFVIDGTEGLTDQDMRILGWALDSGKGLVVAINKWDAMDNDQKDMIKDHIDRKLGFVDYARRYYISALHGSGVGKLYRAIDEAYAAANKELSTSKLTKALEKAVHDHQPPLINGRRIKCRYAHLGGHNPLLILIHGKQVEQLPGSYKRYLVKFFRGYFDIEGVPVQLFFKNDENPYDNKDGKKADKIEKERDTKKNPKLPKS